MDRWNEASPTRGIVGALSGLPQSMPGRSPLVYEFAEGLSAYLQQQYPRDVRAWQYAGAMFQVFGTYLSVGAGSGVSRRQVVTELLPELNGLTQYACEAPFAESVLEMQRAVLDSRAMEKLQRGHDMVELQRVERLLGLH